MIEHKMEERGPLGAPAEQSPAEIERQIARTRERMGRDMDALGDRLNPANIKEQAKEAVVEQARQTGSQVGDFFRRHGVPALVVGVGVTWLIRTWTSEQGVSGDRMARFAYTGPDRREPNGRPSLGRRLNDTAERVRDSVDDAASEAKDRLGQVADKVKRSEFNPMLLLAGAAALGLIVGMALPETERENEMLGPVRDDLADRVETTAARVKETAIDAGREVGDVLKGQVAEHGPELRSTLEEAGSEVGQRVTDAAGRVVEEVKDAAKGRG